MPTRRKVEEPTKRTSRERTGRDSTSKAGWADVIRRQKEYEDKKEMWESERDKPRDFWLKSGEVSVVQFADNEPYTFDGHQIKDGRGNWKFEPCQLSTQKHCLMCRENIKQSWRGAFKVWDYRGSWDKDKSEFTWDEPVEKIWVVNMTTLGALQSQITKRGKQLSDMVLEVTKTGKGTATQYNFETAYDDKDNRMKPRRDLKENYGSIRELVVPRSDDELIAAGFEKPEEDDDKPKFKRRGK